MVRPFHDPQMRFRSAPVLETERLRLRGFELCDLDYFQQFFADETATAYVGGPSSGEDNWRRFLAGSAFWPLLGIGMWIVESRETGKAIGHVGLFDFLRDSDPPIAGEVEMGWIIAPEAHGKGIASEACRAMLEWFDRYFPGQRIFAMISPGNDPSMRLAERLGFVRLPDGTYRDHAQTMWVRG